MAYEINQSSVQAVNGVIADGHITCPLYDSYNFARIPGTVAHALGVGDSHHLPLDVLPSTSDEPYDAVVVILVDAFGSRFVDAYKEEPWLKPILERSKSSTLTSQFPSTTAAHVTTICSGLPVNQTGIYEWLMYLPEAGGIIVPLPYMLISEKRGDKLLVPPEKFLPSPTFPEKLAKHDIRSYYYFPESYLLSAYNSHFLRGVIDCHYNYYGEGIIKMSEALALEKGSSYHYFYLPDFDETIHFSGPTSNKGTKVLERFFKELEKEFFAPLERLNKKVLVVITADHGMLEVSPTGAVYLDKEIPNLAELSLTGSDGKILGPAGSSRDLFMHFKEERIDEGIESVRKCLGELAQVHRTSDLIARGLFGSGTPSKQFLERVGNVVVLPKKGQLIYLYGLGGRFAQRFHGHHGGLSTEEVLIPFIASTNR